MAKLIDGKAVAAEIIEKIKLASADLTKRTGVIPGLAVVIVGDDPASHTYVAAKGRRAKECGFHSIQITLEADTSQADLEAHVAALNADPAVHGILVQLPLPRHLDEDRVVQMILPEKDVDGLNVVNAGKLATGDFNTGLISCTPAGAMVLVRRERGDDLSGLSAVVIGRSNLFGRPMGRLLLAANATVTMAHSRTADLAAVCRQADILVAATGRAEMVKADWVKPGATVIDVGITRVPAPEKGEGKTRLIGDVDFAAVETIAGAITPVPGGVGPMTITMLMANTVIAACRAAGVDVPRF
ncbi:bifunctional methylenetetrahydrofolate dehydrogenase/methenyltetrahydrofolate cyclohydrolase FolD [Martelella sp. HB161492]|uniref:bifunctional methylenetetrahydrofolate dehydrogenase/methenyltetrahydrofolate cyclohydrolase FolD n=1 Tax=Martelella sp. HB161492 TaxID=2720726 RepID=UPI001590A155|nr:bifunctional methylenetetrahydrofolate dehydrogenase/methenyltetrahydrofolate cyclohydrolase FolD [Martelella sp. HB161492]